MSHFPWKWMNNLTGKLILPNCIFFVLVISTETECQGKLTAKINIPTKLNSKEKFKSQTARNNKSFGHLFRNDIIFWVEQLRTHLVNLFTHSISSHAHMAHYSQNCLQGQYYCVILTSVSISLSVLHAAMNNTFISHISKKLFSIV